MNYIELFTNKDALTKLKAAIPEKYQFQVSRLLDDVFSYLYTDESFFDEEFVVEMAEFLNDFSISEFESRLLTYTSGVAEISGSEDEFSESEISLFLDNDFVTGGETAFIIIRQITDMTTSKRFDELIIYKLCSMAAQLPWLDTTLLSLVHLECTQSPQEKIRKAQVPINEYGKRLMKKVWQDLPYVSSRLGTQLSLAYADKILNDRIKFGCEQYQKVGLYDVIAKYPKSEALKYQGIEFELRKEKQYDNKFGPDNWALLTNNYAITYLKPTEIFDAPISRFDIKHKPVDRKIGSITKALERFKKTLPDVTSRVERKLAIAKLEQNHFVDYDENNNTFTVKEGHVLCDDMDCPCHENRKKKEQKKQ